MTPENGGTAGQMRAVMRSSAMISIASDYIAMKSKASVPTVGKPARGSRTGRPIMAALDLLGRRGALRVIWELRESSLTFRALQDAAQTNPALLNTRLKELRQAGLVEHVGDGYALTQLGRELLSAIAPLSQWATRWGRAVTGRAAPY
jgi:DNA-binding HxlR family transcriptional regulator